MPREFRFLHCTRNLRLGKNLKLLEFVKLMRKTFGVAESLGEAGLLGGHVAPLLDDGLLDLPGVALGPGADLLGHINALLGGLELGHQLGDVSAGSLGLEGALLLGGVLDHGLGFVEALLSSLLESAASGGTQLTGLLGAAGDGSVLLHGLLLDVADLSGPLGALGEGGVAGGLILALLILDGLALNNVILNIMDLLLGPALGLVLGPADLGALDVTVLDQGSPAHLNGLVEGNLLVVDEAVLPEVLLALLLLLGLVVGDVAGVAPPVVGMVTLDSLVVLGLLNHLDLVDATLSVTTGAGGGYGGETHINIAGSLSGSTVVKSLNIF